MRWSSNGKWNCFGIIVGVGDCCCICVGNKFGKGIGCLGWFVDRIVVGCGIVCYFDYYRVVYFVKIVDVGN